MTDVYVIRNQLGHYWGKSKLWVDGLDAKSVKRTRHEDDAINTLFELSSADFELRGEVVEVALNDKQEPVVEPSENPLPILDAEVEADADTDNKTEEESGASTTAEDSDAETAVVEGSADANDQAQDDDTSADTQETFETVQVLDTEESSLN